MDAPPHVPFFFSFELLLFQFLRYDFRIGVASCGGMDELVPEGEGMCERAMKKRGLSNRLQRLRVKECVNKGICNKQTHK